MKSSLNPLEISLRDQMEDLFVQVWKVGYLVIVICRRRRGLKVDSILNPINLWVPFLEPGHFKDNLGLREPYNHEFYHVREDIRGE